ncbi:MAG: VTT domain-containing protein [Candidatus Aenigmatarchaeota archaeon]
MAFNEIVASFIAWASSISATWGYLGIFLVSFFGTSTVFFPVLPTTVVIFAFGAIFNPWLVGLCAGIGGALGELTTYFLGRGGRRVLKNKNWIKRAERWAKHWGVFLVILIFNATPLPADVAGLVGGVIGYDLKKFFLACLIGKIFAYMLVAFAGYFGMAFILDVLISGA